VAAGLRGAAAVALLLAVTGCTSVLVRLEMRKANEAYNTKHYDRAMEGYQRVLQMDPSYKDAYLNLGLSYLSLYEPGSIHEKDIAYSQGAIKAFKDLLAIEPDNEKVKNYLIEVCTKSNNHEEAINFFQQEQQRHPDDIRTITLIGNLYSKIGDIDKALEWMQKRVDLEPDNAEAFYTIGVNCWARSYNRMDLTVEQRFAILDKGIAALDKAMSLRPEYFEAYTYKNLILRQKAAFETNPEQQRVYTAEADVLLKKALEIRAKHMQEQAAKAAESKAGTQ